LVKRTEALLATKRKHRTKKGGRRTPEVEILRTRLERNTGKSCLKKISWAFWLFKEGCWENQNSDAIGSTGGKGGESEWTVGLQREPARGNKKLQREDALTEKRGYRKEP